MLNRHSVLTAVRPTSHRVDDMPNPIDLPGQAVAKIQQYAERGVSELHYLRKIIESGTFRLDNPLNYAAMAADIAKWGEIGMLPSFNARRTPNRAAIIDDDGSFTYRELDEAANAVAHGLLAKGVRGGDGVAILARNHRWFAVAEFGCARVGARIILLNSSFSGPADQRGVRARGRQTDHLRRRIHRGRQPSRPPARQTAGPGHQSGRQGIGQRRRDPG